MEAEARALEHGLDELGAGVNRAEHAIEDEWRTGALGPRTRPPGGVGHGRSVASSPLDTVLTGEAQQPARSASRHRRVAVEGRDRPGLGVDAEGDVRRACRATASTTRSSGPRRTGGPSSGPTGRSDPAVRGEPEVGAVVATIGGDRRP